MFRKKRCEEQQSQNYPGKSSLRFLNRALPAQRVHTFINTKHQQRQPGAVIQPLASWIQHRKEQ